MRATSRWPFFSCSQTPSASSEREPSAARMVRISSVNQLLSTALRIKKMTPSRVARPPIQASTRPPNSRSNSIREIGFAGGGGGAACRGGCSDGGRKAGGTYFDSSFIGLLPSCLLTDGQHRSNLVNRRSTSRYTLGHERPRLPPPQRRRAPRPAAGAWRRSVHQPPLRGSLDEQDRGRGRDLEIPALPLLSEQAGLLRGNPGRLGAGASGADRAGPGAAAARAVAEEP